MEPSVRSEPLGPGGPSDGGCDGRSGWSCPYCGAPGARRLARTEYAGVFFVVRAPHECVECGRHFLVPCGWFSSVLTVATGLLMLGAALMLDLIPRGRALLRGDVSVLLVLHMMGACVTAVAGLWLVLVGVQARRYKTWYWWAVRNAEHTSRREA